MLVVFLTATINLPLNTNFHSSYSMDDLFVRKVVNYLRINKVLEGEPVYESTIEDFVPVIIPKAYWDEYYLQEPYWGNKQVEFHESAFKKINQELKETNLDRVQEKALKEIPNEENTVIVELGSGSGRNGAGYLASRKPKAKVILVCKPWVEESPPTYLFETYPGVKHTLTFTRGRELLEEPNIETLLNNLYKANGINNVTFYGREVDETLPDFLKGYNGKDVYLFGHKSPKRLPFIIGRYYQEMDAKYMCVSLTAQEKTRPDEFIWKIIQKNLGLSDEELQGFIKSAHDPKAAAVKDSLSEKYDYKIPAQQRIGVMIKMGIALALAKEVNGNVLRGVIRGARNYNRIDHYVEAYK